MESVVTTFFLFLIFGEVKTTLLRQCCESPFLATLFLGVLKTNRKRNCYVCNSPIPLALKSDQIFLNL